jgi:prepilin-type N-terminal cleavage/methylation domain-containing protein
MRTSDTNVSEGAEFTNNLLVAKFAPCQNGKNGIMKIKTSCKAGFTLVEIMIVVAIIGLLAGMAVYNYYSARSQAQMNTCINNLRQINGAKQQWAMEQGKMINDTPVDSDIQPYLGHGANGSLTSVVCPLNPTGGFDGSYTIGSMGIPPQCNVGGVGGTKYDANYPHVLN